jgi:drug/metabolite transporter (DMT)-like permease
VTTPSKLEGRLYVLAGALLWSTSGIFAKATIFSDWPVETRGPMLAFWRATFAMLVLAPAVRRPRWQWWLLPLAICFTGMNVTYLTSMTRTTAANAIWLQSTAPWWVFLLSVTLFREPIVRRDLIPLLFGMLGVGTILAFESAYSEGVARSGVFMGLLSGVCYAGVVLLMRRLREEDSAWIVAFNHAVAAAVLLPWVLLIAKWPTLTQIVVIALFGTFQMAIPYLLLIRGLRAINSQEAVALGLIEPVLNPVWVYLAWGEEPSWWTLIGAGLILLGLTLRYVVWELLARRRPLAA